MNKKVIISLSVIAVVATVGIGATVAYFNDVETSTGNVITAGTIDLKVDHTRETYNGVDCKTCNVTVKSGTTDYVVETAQNAELLTFVHPAWTADVDGSENDAKWIWATDPITQEDVENGATYTFRKTFEWWGPFTGATVSFGVAADNNYEVRLNGTQIASDYAGNNFSSADAIVVDLTPYINQGTNTLEFVVTNLPRPGWSPTSNPAGLLYKVVIDGNCDDDYFKTSCHLWGPTDLTDEHFWDFDDVKPGDWGTNVISLHVTSNDAYVCMLTDNEENNENTRVDSEVDAGDTSDDEGELSSYLNVAVWQDDNGDGVHDSGEVVLYQGGFNGLNAGIGTLSVPGNGNDNLGMAWCLGEQEEVEDSDSGEISCDGSGNQDQAQTDSLVADLVLYATQQRNNGDFTCQDVVLHPEQ